MVGCARLIHGVVFMRGRLGRAALAVILIVAVSFGAFELKLHVLKPSPVASAAQLVEDEAPVATVIGAEGAVSVIRDQGTPDERVMSPVKVGLLLFRGDQIWTGEDGWLELQFDESARALVAPNSRVEVVSGLVRELDEQTRRLLPTLRLVVGRVYAHVAGALSRLKNFSVETPSAIAGVRGTIFSVDAGMTGKTVVSVQRGVVAVSTPQLPRNESLVGAGEEIEVLPGQALPLARALGPIEAQRWEAVREWLERQSEWRSSRGLGERMGFRERFARFISRVFGEEHALGSRERPVSSRSGAVGDVHALEPKEAWKGEPAAGSGALENTGAGWGFLPSVPERFPLPAFPKLFSGGVFRRHRDT